MEAVVLAIHNFQTPHGKTAHGLVRDASRFSIRCVVDPSCAGKDAGEVLDGQRRGIPIVDSVAAAKEQFPGLQACVVGMATKGGVLPPVLIDSLEAAMIAGLNVYNGLHEPVGSRAHLKQLAHEHGITIHDIRQPPATSDLHFWTGEILRQTTPVVAILGLDCNLGKRTTTRFLMHACEDAGMSSAMVYTGQTGWLQGSEHGFIFDSIPNDFVSGELEHAVVSCIKDKNPDVVFLEGQSSLRNPSGPCGAEFLLSAGARGVILVHAPTRKFYQGFKNHGLELPSLASELQLISLYGSEVIGVVINEEGLSPQQALEERDTIMDEFSLPCVRGLTDGVADLVKPLRAFLEKSRD